MSSGGPREVPRSLRGFYGRSMVLKSVSEAFQDASGAFKGYSKDFQERYREFHWYSMMSKKVT